MWRCGRSFAIGLLLIAFGHAPIPWAHSHAALSAEQLKVHACAFHPGVPPANLPQHWHLHLFFQVALDGDVSDTAMLDFSQTRRCEKSNSLAHPGNVGIGVVDPRKTHGLVRLLDNRVPSHTFPSRDLFKKYGSFLN